MGRRFPHTPDHRRHRGGYPLGRPCGHLVGRPAPPGGPGAAAGGRLRCADVRRAHQPPGHPGHPLAGRAPAHPLAPGPGGFFGGNPRPLVPRRGMHLHVGGARPPGGALRGRLLGLYHAARRARARGPRHRRAPPEQAAPRTGVAVARGPGPGHQAEVPCEGGPGAHRRCAAPARPVGAEAHGHHAPGQAGGRCEERHRGVRRPQGTRRRGMAHRPRGPPGHRGRERRRQDHPGERHTEEAVPHRWLREGGEDGEVRRAVPALGRAERPGRRPRAPGGGALRPRHHAGRQGPDPQAAAGAAARSAGWP